MIEHMIQGVPIAIEIAVPATVAIAFVLWIFLWWSRR